MPFLLKNKQGNLTDIFLDICNVCDKTLKKKQLGDVYTNSGKWLPPEWEGEDRMGSYVSKLVHGYFIFITLFNK